MSKLVKFNAVGYIYPLTETNILLTDMPTQDLVITITTDCPVQPSHFQRYSHYVWPSPLTSKKFFCGLHQNDSRPCT